MTLSWFPRPDVMGLTEHMHAAVLPDGTTFLISRDPDCGWAASMRALGGQAAIVQPGGETLPMREQNVCWYASRRMAEEACEKAVARRRQ